MVKINIMENIKPSAAGVVRMPDRVSAIYESHVSEPTSGYNYRLET